MKTFKQFYINEKRADVIFDDIISRMISQPGYQGHEIMGDEIVFSFDSDGNADVAYSNLDAEELEHLDNDFDDGFDIDDMDPDDYEEDYWGDIEESVTEAVIITEAKVIVKVNSKGQKRKRVKCKRGFKLNSKGTACIPISGKEKATKKRSIRKSVKTKKQQGKSYSNRSDRKRKKAMKKRKAMGY